MKENAPAHGVWPPVATPFHADLSIDFERYIAHCKDLLARGAHGLAVLGTTSEANSLDIGEREAVLERLVAAGIAADQLMPGTGAPSIGDAVRLTRQAASHGVRGVLLLPPFYYKDVSDDGLFAFVSEVIGRVGDSKLRVYLYNFPRMTGIIWSPALIGHLIKSFPKTVVGLKDSSGDVAYMNRLLDSYPGFAVFAASEALLLAAMQKGAAGFISATGNIQVGALRALYDGWQSGEAERLSRRASAVRILLQKFPLIPAVKAVIAENTKAPDWTRVRPPLDPISPGERKMLVAGLETLAAGALA